MFDKPHICKQCGGTCCNSMPGCCYPEDFGLPDTSKLEEALKSGRYCFDWWEGDPRPGKKKLSRGLYIRPSIKTKEGKLYDPAWTARGLGCTFLESSGCTLPSDQRPYECRMLEPMPEFKCIMHNKAGKRQSAIAWVPWIKELKTIAERVENYS